MGYGTSDGQYFNDEFEYLAKGYSANEPNQLEAITVPKPEPAVVEEDKPLGSSSFEAVYNASYLPNTTSSGNIEDRRSEDLTRIEQYMNVKRMGASPDILNTQFPDLRMSPEGATYKAADLDRRTPPPLPMVPSHSIAPHNPNPPGGGPYNIKPGEKLADATSWLKSWLGIKPEPDTKPDTKPQTIKQEAPTTQWPTNEDRVLSSKVDRAYADPSESYFTGGKGTVREVSVRNALDWYNKDKSFEPNIRPITSEESDEIHKAWIAAERTPVAKLGFSPGKMYVTPDANLSSFGAYAPNQDNIWYDSSSRSTPVHESIHRGITMMEKEGVMPKELSRINQELLVRALMTRHFGDEEYNKAEANKKQIEEARKKITSEQLDKLEEAAAKYIAKKRPGGPR